MDNYHIYEQIGSGPRSKVYKARKKKTLEYCAVKRTPKEHAKDVAAEVAAQTACASAGSHANVLQLLAWFATSRSIYRVLEHCSGGDLATVISQDGGLPEAAARLFGLDLALGLLHVHSRGVLMCDLKPAGVLLDENGTLRISDFGAAQLYNDPAKPPRVTKCTISYMAPELFEDGALHSRSSDLWTLGICLFELACGHRPFDGATHEETVDHILNAPSPKMLLPRLPGPGTAAPGGSGYGSLDDSIDGAAVGITRGVVSGSTSIAELRQASGLGPAAHHQSQHDEHREPASALFTDLISNLLSKDPHTRCSWMEVLSHRFWRGSGLGGGGQEVIQRLLAAQRTAEQLPIELHSMQHVQASIHGAPEVNSGLARAGASKNRLFVSASSASVAAASTLTVPAQLLSSVPGHQGTATSAVGSAGIPSAGGGVPTSAAAALYVQDAHPDNSAERGNPEGVVVEEGNQDARQQPLRYSQANLIRASLPTLPSAALTQAHAPADVQAGAEVANRDVTDTHKALQATAGRSLGGIIRQYVESADGQQLQHGLRQRLEPAGIRAMLASATDTTVQPVVTCARPPPLKPELLPFRCFSAVELLSTTGEESVSQSRSAEGSGSSTTGSVQSQLSSLYRTIVTGDHQVQLAALSYIYHLAEADALANWILNSSITTLLVKLVQRSSSVVVQARAALVLGRLIQQATFLSAAVIYEHGLLKALADCVEGTGASIRRRSVSSVGGTGSGGLPSREGSPLKVAAADSSVVSDTSSNATTASVAATSGASLHPTVRQQAAAAFGELLFYVATQVQQETQELQTRDLDAHQHTAAGDAPGGGAADNTATSGAAARQWSVPEWLASFLLKHIVTATEADVAVRTYVLLALCNVAILAPKATAALQPTQLMLAVLHEFDGAANAPSSATTNSRLSLYPRVLVLLAASCTFTPAGTDARTEMCSDSKVLEACLRALQSIGGTSSEASHPSEVAGICNALSYVLMSRLQSTSAASDVEALANACIQALNLAFAFAASGDGSSSPRETAAARSPGRLSGGASAAAEASLQSAIMVTGLVLSEATMSGALDAVQPLLPLLYRAIAQRSSLTIAGKRLHAFAPSPDSEDTDFERQQHHEGTSAQNQAKLLFAAEAVGQMLQVVLAALPASIGSGSDSHYDIGQQLGDLLASISDFLSALPLTLRSDCLTVPLIECLAASMESYNTCTSSGSSADDHVAASLVSVCACLMPCVGHIHEQLSLRLFTGPATGEDDGGAGDNFDPQHDTERRALLRAIGHRLLPAIVSCPPPSQAAAAADVDGRTWPIVQLIYECLTTPAVLACADMSATVESLSSSFVPRACALYQSLTAEKNTCLTHESGTASAVEGKIDPDDDNPEQRAASLGMVCSGLLEVIHAAIVACAAAPGGSRARQLLHASSGDTRVSLLQLIAFVFAHVGASSDEENVYVPDADALLGLRILSRFIHAYSISSSATTAAGGADNGSSGSAACIGAFDWIQNVLSDDGVDPLHAGTNLPSLLVSALSWAAAAQGQWSASQPASDAGTASDAVIISEPHPGLVVAADACFAYLSILLRQLSPQVYDVPGGVDAGAKAAAGDAGVDEHAGDDSIVSAHDISLATSATIAVNSTLDAINLQHPASSDGHNQHRLLNASGLDSTFASSVASLLEHNSSFRSLPRAFASQAAVDAATSSGRADASQARGRASSSRKEPSGHERGRVQSLRVLDGIERDVTAADDGGEGEGEDGTTSTAVAARSSRAAAGAGARDDDPITTDDKADQKGTHALSWLLRLALDLESVPLPSLRPVPVAIDGAANDNADEGWAQAEAGTGVAKDVEGGIDGTYDRDTLVAAVEYVADTLAVAISFAFAVINAHESRKSHPAGAEVGWASTTTSLAATVLAIAKLAPLKAAFHSLFYTDQSQSILQCSGLDSSGGTDKKAALPLHFLLSYLVRNVSPCGHNDETFLLCARLAVELLQASDDISSAADAYLRTAFGNAVPAFERWEAVLACGAAVGSTAITNHVDDGIATDDGGQAAAAPAGPASHHSEASMHAGHNSSNNVLEARNGSNSGAQLKRGVFPAGNHLNDVSASSAARACHGSGSDAVAAAAAVASPARSTSSRSAGRSIAAGAVSQSHSMLERSFGVQASESSRSLYYSVAHHDQQQSVSSDAQIDGSTSGDRDRSHSVSSSRSPSGGPRVVRVRHKHAGAAGTQRSPAGGSMG